MVEVIHRLERVRAFFGGKKPGQDLLLLAAARRCNEHSFWNYLSV